MRELQLQTVEISGGGSRIWTTLDADSKLIISYLLGQRVASWARSFMEDVAPLAATRIQTTTYGHHAYAEASEGAFDMDVDYAMLTKIYGQDSIRP
jgi:hypothetical protein